MNKRVNAFSGCNAGLRKSVTIRVRKSYLPPAITNALREFKESVLTKFVIKGTDDKARQALKTGLEAQNAKFEAGLSALFKSPAPVTVTAAPAAKAPAKAPAEPVAKQSARAGWSLDTDRNRRFKN